MTEKCTFCFKPQYCGTFVALADNKTKFDNLMEAVKGFEFYDIENPWTCRDCDNKICNFFDFKSAFMEKEEELLNYVKTRRNVDLYQILLICGRLEKIGNLEKRIRMKKVCRLCFTIVEPYHYREIKSLKGELAKIISICLPDFDFTLTDKIHVCLECNSTLIKYHHFLMLSMDSLKASPTLKKPSALNCNSSIKKRKVEQSTVQVASGQPPPKIFQKSGPEKHGHLSSHSIDPSEEASAEQINSSLIKNVPEIKTTRRKVYSSAKQIQKIVLSGTIYSELRNSSFECQICPAVFDSLSAILKHIDFHRKQTTKFTCWKCEASFNLLSVLHGHLGIHGIELFKIVVEDREADDTFSLAKGSKLETNAPRKRRKRIIENYYENKFEYIECQICLEKLPSFSLFQQHLKPHIYSDDFRRLKCPFNCQIVTDVQKHMATEHGIPYLFRAVSAKAECNSLEETTPDSATKEDLPISENMQMPVKGYDDGDLCPTSDGQYSCGHCSALFYGFDELEEHKCTMMPTVSTNGFCDSRKKEDNENGFIVPNQDCHIMKQSEVMDNKENVGTGRFNNITVPVKIKCDDRDITVGVQCSIKEEDQVEKLACVGCHCKIPKEEGDLKIPHNCCENVRKCPACPFTTNIAEAHILESHCYFYHRLIIFVCPYCKFVALVQELLAVHMRTHSSSEQVVINEENGVTVVEGNEVVDFLFETGTSDSEGDEETNKHMANSITNNIENDSDNISISRDLSKKNSNLDNIHPIRLIKAGSIPKILEEAESLVHQDELIVPDIQNSLFINEKSLGSDLLKLAKDNHNVEQRNTDNRSNCIGNRNNFELQLAATDAIEVIDIDSESDNELTESTQNRIGTSSTVVQKSTSRDHQGASQAISQGVPIAGRSQLQKEIQRSPGISLIKSCVSGFSASANSNLIPTVPDSSSTSIVISIGQNKQLRNDSRQPPDSNAVSAPPENILIKNRSIIDRVIMDALTDTNVPQGQEREQKRNPNIQNKNDQTVERNHCIIISDDEMEESEKSAHPAKPKDATNKRVIIVHQEIRIRPPNNPDQAIKNMSNQTTSKPLPEKQSTMEEIILD